jgi:phospho-N-acetylmuramoyl-pentapeptide-transferase
MLSTQVVLFLVVFVATLLMAPLGIPLLKKIKIRQIVRDDGPTTHLSKMGTPTMGGLLFIFPIAVAGFMYARFDKRILPILLVFIGFALVGFLDDFMKISKKSKDGLYPKQKMLGLILISAIFSFYMANSDIGTSIVLPVLGFSKPFDLGIWYIPFTMLVFIASTNAVNITDGLDGLAAGVTFFVSLFFALVAMLYYDQEYVNFFAVALCGGCLGFLMYNFYPAKIFMGDTGSLALGGAVAALSVVLRVPLILLVVGGIYVLEAASVIVQVASFKLRKKRVFKMAPIHHHFELSGWKETSIVYLFWGITILLGVLGLYLLRVNFLWLFMR